MGKGTADKIKKLFEKGNLDPYLHYLDANRDWHPLVEQKKSRYAVTGLFYQWLAETAEDSLKEALRIMRCRGLLPQDLMATAEALALPSKSRKGVADQAKKRLFMCYSAPLRVDS